MAFQPSMFLYANRADLHWSANCSRALLAGNSQQEMSSQDLNVDSLEEQQQQRNQQLASAILMHHQRQQQQQQQQQQLTKLNLNLNQSSRLRMHQEQQFEESSADSDISEQHQHNNNNSARLNPYSFDQDRSDSDEADDDDNHFDDHHLHFSAPNQDEDDDQDDDHEQVTALNLSLRTGHERSKLHNELIGGDSHRAALEPPSSARNHINSHQHHLQASSFNSSASSSYSTSSSSSSSSSSAYSSVSSLASCSPEQPHENHLSNGHHQQHQLQLQPHRPLFLHHQHHQHELGPVHKTDSDDLDRIRNFIEQFKARRGALGLTQKQAAQCFRAYTNDRYAFSDNFVGHFEGFQFRPQTAMTIADSLAEWLEFAEQETRLGRQLNFMPGKVKETRKRKYEVIRIRDSAKRVLVDAFEKNKSPSTSELEQLSRKTNIPSRNIEIFFKNRRTSRQYHQ